MGCFIFAPMHGTELRKIAESKGSVDPKTFCDIGDVNACILNQPQLSRAGRIGIAKTFGLYQTAPESDWDRVALAEPDTFDGNAMFDVLMQEYRPGDVGASASTTH